MYIPLLYVGLIVTLFTTILCARFLNPKQMAFAFTVHFLALILLNYRGYTDFVTGALGGLMFVMLLVALVFSETKNDKK